jgi:hypothetical protein
MSSFFRVGVLAMLLVGVWPAQAQYLFSVTFRGTNYQADASGKIVPLQTTEDSILKEIAERHGIADPKTLALIYHIQGSGFGDTIDAVYANSGASVQTFLGLFFGDDPTLDRLALTNAAGTEIRRLDFLYTDQNTHSMGVGFTTKRFVPGDSGAIRATFEGQLHWVYLPTGNYPIRVCTGAWTTTRPFAPKP